jgi:hypothetical protein
MTNKKSKACRLAGLQLSVRRLMRAGGTAAGFYFLEEPDDDDAAEAE